MPGLNPMTADENRQTKRCTRCGAEVLQCIRIQSIEVKHGWSLACPACAAGEKVVGSWTRCIRCGKRMWRANPFLVNYKKERLVSLR